MTLELSEYSNLEIGNNVIKIAGFFRLFIMTENKLFWKKNPYTRNKAKKQTSCIYLTKNLITLVFQ